MKGSEALLSNASLPAVGLRLQNKISSGQVGYLA